MYKLCQNYGNKKHYWAKEIAWNQQTILFVLQTAMKCFLTSSLKSSQFLRLALKLSDKTLLFWILSNCLCASSDNNWYWEDSSWSLWNQNNISLLESLITEIGLNKLSILYMHHIIWNYFTFGDSIQSSYWTKHLKDHILLWGALLIKMHWVE